MSGTTTFNPMANPIGNVITGKTQLLGIINAYTNAFNNYEGCNTTGTLFTSFVPTYSSTNVASATQSCPITVNSGGTPGHFNSTDKFFDASGNVQSLTPISTAYSLTDLSNNIQLYSTNIANSISELTTGTNTLSQAVINTRYNRLNDHRSEMDVELQNLYNIPNSVPNQYLSNIDTRAYTGVLWGVLATSLVYYIFTKL